MRVRYVLVAFLLTLALCRAAPDGSALSLCLLGGLWLLSLSACAAADFRVERAAWLGAAIAAFAAWSLEPRAWVVAAALLVIAAVNRALAANRRESAPLLLSLALGVALPCAVTLAIATLAESDGGLTTEVLRPLRAARADPFSPLGLALAAWVGAALAARARGEQRATPGLAWLCTAAALAFLVAHGRWFASVATFPAEMRWSEAPHLTNLLKLEAGVPLYGPFQDCNSYVYSPLLELIHRSLLGPFGRALDLTAHRALVLVWHALSAALVSWALWPRLPRSAPARLTFVALVLVAVTSSFVAPNLHPDHLMMVAFATAIALVSGEERMPRWLFLAGLVVVPVVGTMAKLTGAGIGLGLVLALALPPRRGPLLALAAGGVLALLTIPLFDATLGDFSRWTVDLMASHPRHFSKLGALFGEGAGRLALIALLTAALPWLLGRAAEGENRRRVLRLLALTAGFSLLALAGYVKEGGRSNSLLPLTVGGACLLVELAHRLPRAIASRTLLGPGALAVMLVAAAPPAPLSRDDAEVAREHRDHAVTLVTRETAAGRKTLLYGATWPWLIAGRRDVPLDRWQSVAELSLGHRPEVEAFFSRLERGHYESVIVSDHVLNVADDPEAERVSKTLSSHYRREVTLTAGGGQLELHLYRHRR